MRDVDLGPLIENDQAFSKLKEDIKKRYQCNWDDPVHDSYRSFVQEAEERSSIIHEIRCKAESVKSQMDAYHVDTFADEAENLRIEAQTI